MRTPSNPYRLEPLAGTPEQVANKLRELDTGGWRLVTVLPYRPDIQQELIIWEPWAVLRHTSADSGIEY